MAGKINVPVTVALQGLANTQKQLSMLGKGVGGAGRSAALAAVGFAAFAAGVKSADFAMQAISGARDLERNLLGVKTVFEELTPQMTQFTKQAQAMGLGMTDASKAVTFIGSVLKQSGFSIGETADLTERLVGLATDLSITYGYDVQEALMGMTALFRGEYDPIEKFGVAMKQSEINSELAAKGMGNLEGAQRRLAEQQVRVQLLFERSADAQGAMARGAGTLAVEQLKLAASYENIRDTVAVSMLPVIAGIFEEIQVSVENLREPLTELFEAAAPAVRNLAEVLLPALSEAVVTGIEALTNFMTIVEALFDPTTDLGISVNNLLISLGSLGSTISGSVPGGFDVLGSLLELLEAISIILGEIVRFLEISAIFWGNFLRAVGTLFDLDPNNFLETDWSGQVAGAIAVRDAYVRQQVAVKGLNFELRRTSDISEAINRQAAGLSLSNLPKYIRDSLKPKSTITGGGGPAAEKKQAEDFVGDFFKNIKEEVAKQTARMRLERMGASAGLIDSIVSGEGWKKVFENVIKSGAAGLAKIQRDFNKTSAGVKELEQARKEAADAAKEAEEQAAKAAQELAEKLAEANEELQTRIDLLNDFAKDIKKLASFDVLSTFERQLGRFEQSSVDNFKSIRDSVQEAFDNGLILETSLRDLLRFVSAEEQALNEIQRNRDELAERYSLADTLIKEYRTAFTAAVNLTSLFGQLKGETEERTVREVTKGVVAMSNGLREFNVTVTREYEETIDKITDKTAGVVDGFRDIAAKARVFAGNLRQLQQLNLNPQLFAQLVEAGVEAGGETAQALVDGGSDTIREINSLFEEIDALGADLGEDVAKTLYGKGVDMSNGLLAGIKSLQSQFEATAKSMAELFAVAFANAIDAAIELARQKLVNELPMITTPAGGPVGSGAAFPNAIIITPEAPPIDMPRGFVPMPGGSPFPTGGVINYNTFNIKTDATTSNAMVGKTIATTLTSYTQTGGQVAI